MNSIPLIQPRHAGNAVEQKRSEFHTFGLGDFPEQRVEVGRVPLPKIRRCFHLHQQNFRRRVVGTHAHNDCANIRRRRIGVEPTESVVRAGLDHDQIGLLLEQPIQPAERTGRGLAAETGIDDVGFDACGIGEMLQDGRVRVARRIVESVAGGETGAEKQNTGRARRDG